MRPAPLMLWLLLGWAALRAAALFGRDPRFLKPPLLFGNFWSNGFRFDFFDPVFLVS